MTEARGEITGKKPATGCVDPITVTVKEASALTGLGLTTVWRLIKEERLRTRHVPGVARTLVDFGSLRALLTEPAETAAAPRRPRPRGGSLKHNAAPSPERR
jgi:hypothetical protein